MLPVESGVSNLQGHCAGFASRFIAFVLDMVVISLSLSAIIWALSQFGLLLQFTIFVDPTEYLINLINRYIVDLGRVENSAIFTVLTFIGPGLFVVIYNVLFWSTAERTPGKAFMGLRVVTSQGKRLRWWRAVIRSVGYILSVLYFIPLPFLGFLRVMWDDQRQALHDKLARTYVVYDWEARPDEQFLVERIQALRTRHLKREHKKTARS
jgi:uncharacterized RDD family membrane protein YckC